MALPAKRRRAPAPTNKGADTRTEPLGVWSSEPTQVHGAADAPTARFARARADGDYDAPTPVAPQEQRKKRIKRETRKARVRLIIGTIIAAALGWLVAFQGWIPGVFRATDLAMPTLFVLLLRLIVKDLGAHAGQGTLVDAGRILPRTTAWGVGAFWTVLTITNVPQLAYGIAIGLLAYALYSTRLILGAHGYDGFGPTLRPTIVTLFAWVAWAIAREAVGWVIGFTLLSIVYGAIVALIVTRVSKRAGIKAAAMRPRSHSPLQSEAVQKADQKRVLVAIVLAYLVFRLFVSARIPYGPIVEWLLICFGVLFFTIIAAGRVGVVPTRRTLPTSDVRRHVQVVSSLPDRRLAETQDAIAGYIDHGKNTAQIHATFSHLFDDLEIDDTASHAVLERLSAAAGHHTHGRTNKPRNRRRQAKRHGPDIPSDPEARRALISEACHILRTAHQGRPGNGLTGTKKTDRPVGRPHAGAAA